MRQFLALPQIRLYTLLALAGCGLGVCLEAVWGWTPGAGCAVLALAPVVLAAVNAGRTTALAVSVTVAAVIPAIVFLTAQTGEVTSALGMAVVTSLLFPAFAAVVGTAIDRLREDLAGVEAQNVRYIGELYERLHEKDAGGEQGGEVIAALPTHAADTSPLPEGVGVPRQLSTLQEIGRRIASNLSLQSLIPTIISTAKVSLNCGQCDVYLWNATDRVFANPRLQKSPDVGTWQPRADTGMAGWVLKHQCLLTRREVVHRHALQQILKEEPHAPYAVAPLAVGGHVLGIIVVDDVKHDSSTFSQLLYVVSNIFALGIKNAQLFQHIQDMARHDGLTGLLNHATFWHELHLLANQCSATGKPLALVMSDIDNFKEFNDTYGHQAGDHVLREVSRLWKAVLPDHAVIGRYGGEEFICALPGEDLQRGRELAELLRKNLESFPLSFEGESLKVTASFGVARWDRSMRSHEDLVRRADDAMYDSKDAGRNRVTCAAVEKNSTKELAELPQ